MKKIIILTALIIGATVAAFTPVRYFQTEKPVSKEINVAISSRNNYSLAAYSDAKASVHVTITKVNGSRQTVVSDKVYSDMSLSQVPTNGNAINSKIVIPNVFNKKEKLLITYTISYNSRGSVVQLCNGTIASDKSNSEKIEIHI